MRRALILASAPLALLSCVPAPPLVLPPLPAREAESLPLPFAGSRNVAFAATSYSIDALGVVAAGNTVNLEFTTFNGSTWSAPVVVARNVEPIAATRFPVSLGVLPDGALRARWFDGTNRPSPTGRVFGSTDGGATWVPVAEVAAEVDVRSAEIGWVDLPDEAEGIAWIGKKRRLFEQESDAVLSGIATSAAEALDASVVATRVVRASGLSAARFGNEMVVAYRELDPPGSTTPNQSTVCVDLVSGETRGHVFTEHDPWALPSDGERGTGPVLAGTLKRLAIVYYSERREGFPALTVVSDPGRARQVIPARGAVRDLRVRISATGDIVIADIEGGFPTVRELAVEPRSFRVGALPVQDDVQLLWEGSLSGREYLLFRSGTSATLNFVRLSDAARAPATTPPAVTSATVTAPPAAGRCVEAVAALREAEAGLRSCLAGGGACEAEFARLQAATHAASGCDDNAGIAAGPAAPGASASPATAATPAPTPAEQWVEATTPHFDVVVEGDEARAREVAGGFERLRARTRATFSDPDRGEPSVRVTVFAARSREQLEALVPGVLGTGPIAVDARPLGAQVFLALDEVKGAIDASEDVLHAYHHLYLDRAAPWAPEWLREGLAETAARAREDGAVLTLGALDAARAHALPPLTASDLLKLSRAATDRAEPAAEESMLFASALLLGEPGGEAKLRGFGEDVSRGVAADEATLRAWGDLTALQQRLDAFRARESFPTRTARIEGVDAAMAAFSAHALSPARVAGFRGLLYVQRGRPDAFVRLAEARRLDSDDAVALEAEGLRRHLAGDRSGAHVWLARAVARPDARFSAFYLAAITVPRDEAGAPESPERADKYLSRALEIEPRFARAISARAALLASRDPEAATALAAKAAALEGGDPSFELRAARVYLEAGDREDAKSLAQRATRRALARHDPTLSSEICLHGAAAGLADSVAPACDAGVAGAPQNWHAYDARGIGRMLRGDRRGAIDDLRFVLDHADVSPLDASRQIRKDWLIALLRNGRVSAREIRDAVDDPLW